MLYTSIVLYVNLVFSQLGQMNMIDENMLGSDIRGFETVREISSPEKGVGKFMIKGSDDHTFLGYPIERGLITTEGTVVQNLMVELSGELVGGIFRLLTLKYGKPKGRLKKVGTPMIKESFKTRTTTFVKREIELVEAPSTEIPDFALWEMNGFAIELKKKELRDVLTVRFLKR